ncbi:MAG: hypothetical protein GWN14_00975, partial [candidate division Zixibacteria bacterium]|nr:hypothetical protein [Gammaproteobacteria bacterium]NIX54534.1 hypothetical protein [candidate division Zixibacteria bacterium]
QAASDAASHLALGIHHGINDRNEILVARKDLYGAADLSNKGITAPPFPDAHDQQEDREHKQNRFQYQ